MGRVRLFVTPRQLFFSKETPSNDLEAVSSDQTSSSEARKRAGAFAPTCPVARECNEVRSCASETTASSVQVPYVKRDADKRSLLHVFVDSLQSGIKNLAVVTDVSMLEHQNQMKKRSTSSHLSSLLPRMSIGDGPTDADQCAICLDAVSSNTSTEVDASSSNSPILLQCEHTFHRKCIPV